MKAIKRLSLSEQVVDSIIQYIRENDLKPGDQLPTESDFAELFQVSRTSIREAMKALSINGIFESTPGKGTFLLPRALTMSMGADGILQMQAEATITEIMEIRTPLEILAIKLAVERGSEDEITVLEGITANYRKAVESGKDFTVWGARSHAQIAAMSGNPLLISTLQLLSEMIDQYRNNLATFFEDNTRYCESHKIICACLRRRDAAGAQEEMRRHMAMTENALKSIVVPENAEKFLLQK